MHKLSRVFNICIGRSLSLWASDCNSLQRPLYQCDAVMYYLKLIVTECPFWFLNKLGSPATLELETRLVFSFWKHDLIMVYLLYLNGVRRLHHLLFDYYCIMTAIFFNEEVADRGIIPTKFISFYFAKPDGHFK